MFFFCQTVQFPLGHVPVGNRCCPIFEHSLAYKGRMALCVLAQKSDEEVVSVKWTRFLIISNVSRIQTAPNAQNAHPRVINNRVSAKHGVNLTNGFVAMQGTDKDPDRFLAVIEGLEKDSGLNIPFNGQI